MPKSIDIVRYMASALVPRRLFVILFSLFVKLIINISKAYKMNSTNNAFNLKASLIFKCSNW